MGIPERFGGPADPLKPVLTPWCLNLPAASDEALGWMLPDRRPTGRLPK